MSTGSEDGSETLRLESMLVSGGRPARIPDAPVNTPITLSATTHAGGERGYARSGTDNTLALEATIGALEGGLATAFSAGMAASNAILDWLPLGSAVVIPSSFYNLQRSYLDALVALGRIELRPVDVTDDRAVVQALASPGGAAGSAAVLWLELPSNPLLQVPDLPVLAAAAKSVGALTVVDSTVATPLGIRPLKHGADVVMHSASKAISGHSDLIMGLLSTADPALDAQFKQRRTLTGSLPGGLDCYLSLRGLRTLSVRLERACANTAVLAGRLAEHPAVRTVHYLGDPAHPNAKQVAALLGNHGALLSFTTDSVQRADNLCARVRLITHATSLGGVESLMERRGAYPGEIAQGTPAELVRLAVGIEHVEDLWDDLEQALSG
jgi:cystathionine gamma-synthase